MKGGNETPLRKQGQERLSGRTTKSKGAGQRHPQMAAACSFGGSAEGGQPFVRGSRGMQSPLGGVQRRQSLGRVQGGSACSGVQRVKPFGPCNPFTDVFESDWFYAGVAYVAQNGLMQGVGGGKFNPSGITSRGMIVTILYRLEGEPAVSHSTFTDVAAGQCYTDAIAWAAANKIVEGYGNNTFGPNDDITREQLATMLWRYAGKSAANHSSLETFPDVAEIHDWAIDGMTWAVENGIIIGSDDKLKP